MPPERTNNVYLMEWAVVQHSELSTKAILILNYCRLYLHVTTISKLFNETGSTILPHMLECKRPPWFNTNQYMPIQLRPRPHQIKTIWKPFCTRWINQNHNPRIHMGALDHTGNTVPTTSNCIYQTHSPRLRLVPMAPNFLPLDSTMTTPYGHSTILRLPLQYISDNLTQRPPAQFSKTTLQIFCQYHPQHWF